MFLAPRTCATHRSEGPAPSGGGATFGGSGMWVDHRPGACRTRTCRGAVVEPHSEAQECGWTTAQARVVRGRAGERWWSHIRRLRNVGGPPPPGRSGSAALVRDRGGGLGGGLGVEVLAT